MDAKPHRKFAHKLPLHKKLIFSAISLALFFALLEGALALVGVLPVIAEDDPFVGFSARVPLLEVSTSASGEQMVATASSKLHWFNAQSFPLKKAATTRRIFCLGGSTTYGHPFWDSTSYSRWLREFLPLADGAHRWEVINLGGVSYASYRVAAIMEELERYEPDLFIVYSAHNEFLERRTYAAMFEKSPVYAHIEGVLAQTRTWAILDRAINFRKKPTHRGQHAGESSIDLLPAEVDEILNHTPGPVDYHRDGVWQANVLRHYETNLRRMVAIARRCRAKIVFIAPASNEKNCSPFKSESDSTLELQQREQFDVLLRQADDLQKAGNRHDALANLESARSIDALHADVHYRLGQLLFELGRHADARKAFDQALNADVCPLRAVRGITTAIGRVAADFSIPVIDFERLLRGKCVAEHGHDILGEEYFLDHVHPTVEVHRQLALWIIADLQRPGLMAGYDLSDPSMETRIAEITRRVFEEIELPSQGIAQRNLAKVLHWAGKFAEASPRARDALKLLPNDPESRYVLADCLTNMGEYDEAISQYELLFMGQVDFDQAYNRFGEVLALRGHFTAAKSYLMLGILQDPKNAFAHRSLGSVHLELGEFKFAVESLKEADSLKPNDTRTLELLKRAQAEINKTQ